MGRLRFISNFKYLGSYLAADGGIGVEISQRVKAAAFAFHRLKAFWKDKHVQEHVKLKIYKAVVQATLLYACETWAATSSTVKALDVFQMQCLRRLFGISKIQHVENVEILKRASMDAVHDVVKFRRLRWLGHISRLPDTRLPKRILFSRIEQKGGRGRPMKCWTDYVREDLDALRILPSWARLAQDREAWRTKIHDLLGHTQP